MCNYCFVPVVMKIVKLLCNKTTTTNKKISTNGRIRENLYAQKWFWEKKGTNSLSLTHSLTSSILFFYTGRYCGELWELNRMTKHPRWHPCFGRWFFILSRRCFEKLKKKKHFRMHKLRCWALDKIHHTDFFFYKTGNLKQWQIKMQKYSLPTMCVCTYKINRKKTSYNYFAT